MSALGWGEGAEQLADVLPEPVGGACGGFAEQCFELGKELFDGVQVRRVGWQIAQACTRRGDGFPDPSHLVAAEVVEDHHVPRLQGWTEEFAHRGEKDLTVHRPVGDHGRGQFMAA